MAATAATSQIDPDFAIRSFFADPEWRVKTAIGATINAVALVALFLNVMTLPLVFALWALVGGYQLRVIRTKIGNPKAKLPEWNDWVDLLISGLTWLAVYTGFVFYVITVPTLATIVGAAQGAIYTPDNRFLVWGIISFSLSFFVFVFTSLFVTYLHANFAEEERMPAAFAFLKVTNRLKERALPLLQAWLLSIGLGAAAVIIPLVSILGIFLIPTTVFIASIISATIVAQAWSK